MLILFLLIQTLLTAAHTLPPKETNRWTGGKLTHNIIKKGTHNLLTPPRLCLQTAEKE
jgi:hypothetical protein